MPYKCKVHLYNWLKMHSFSFTKLWIKTNCTLCSHMLIYLKKVVKYCNLPCLSAKLLQKCMSKRPSKNCLACCCNLFYFAYLIIKQEVTHYDKYYNKNFLLHIIWFNCLSSHQTFPCVAPFCSDVVKPKIFCPTFCTNIKVTGVYVS